VNLERTPAFHLEFDSECLIGEFKEVYILGCLKMCVDLSAQFLYCYS
jgi:hypothetical protein